MAEERAARERAEHAAKESTLRAAMERAATEQDRAARAARERAAADQEREARASMDRVAAEDRAARAARERSAAQQRARDSASSWLPSWASPQAPPPHEPTQQARLLPEPRPTEPPSLRPLPPLATKHPAVRGDASPDSPPLEAAKWAYLPRVTSPPPRADRFLSDSSKELLGTRPRGGLARAVVEWSADGETPPPRPKARPPGAAAASPALSIPRARGTSPRMSPQASPRRSGGTTPMPKARSKHEARAISIAATARLASPSSAKGAPPRATPRSSPGASPRRPPNI